MYIGRIDETIGKKEIDIQDGKIVGLDGVEQALTEKQKQVVGEDLDAQIEEARKNAELMKKDVQDLESKRTKTRTYGGFAGPGASGAGAFTVTSEKKEKSQKQIELENKLAEENDRLRNLQKRRSLLAGGVDAGLVANKNFSTDELSELQGAGVGTIEGLYAQVGFNPNAAEEAAEEVAAAAEETAQAAEATENLAGANSRALLAANPVVKGTIDVSPPVAEVPSDEQIVTADKDYLFQTFAQTRRAADYLKDIRQHIVYLREEMHSLAAFDH